MAEKISGIASTMQNAGMSTLDIMLALYGAQYNLTIDKAALSGNPELRQEIKIDSNHASARQTIENSIINSELETLTQLKSTTIKAVTSLINNKNTKPLGENYLSLIKPQIDQFDRISQDIETLNKNLNNLIIEKNKYLNAQHSDDQTAKRDPDYSKKIREYESKINSISNDIKTKRTELQTLKEQITPHYVNATQTASEKTDFNIQSTQTPQP